MKSELKTNGVGSGGDWELDNHRMLDLNDIYDEARRFLVSKTREKVPGYDVEVLIDQYLSLPDKSQASKQIFRNYLK